MQEKASIDILISKMKQADPTKIKMCIGFDGFVDEVVQVVDKRIDANNFKRIEYLKDYGKKIIKSAGVSMNVEMVTMQQKLGGNGPILANSLIKHGCDVTYLGALGKPDIHPVFKEMASSSRVISFSNPGHTDAIEFLDGKIISSKLEFLKDVCWENLLAEISLENFIKLLDESDLVGFENWTMVVNSTDIWKHIVEEVIPRLKPTKRKKTLFIDLADPEKREKSDIIEALDYMEKFSEYYRVVLGLNLKEACEIAELTGLHIEDYDSVELKELLRYIKKNVAVDLLVIHPVKMAGVIGEDGESLVEGPYCRFPKLTTGAGDNFNAGFILGLMLGFTEKECLQLGTANSGFYVRNARSASYEELMAFLELWKKGQIVESS